MRAKRIGWVGVLSLLLVLAPGTARALTDEEIFRDFRFNFINPGARAVGLGGAFIAAADDVTATQANPAALHYVFRNEFFMEFREVRPEAQVFAEATGDPVSPSPIFLDLQSVNDRQDASLASFASFAMPFKIGSRRATFAVSRQAVLDVESSLGDPATGTTRLRFSTSDYPVWVNPGGLDCGTAGAEQYTVCNNVAGSGTIELIHYNLGLSYSFVDDFSVGLTATQVTLDMVSDVINTTEDPRGVLFTIHPRLETGAGVFAPIQTRTQIDDSDSALAYTVGLHWHPDRAFPGGVSPLRLGLVYRRGADLAVEESKTRFNGTSFVPFDPAEPTFRNTLREPDRVGIGASYEVAKHWTFALDLEQIQYSDLLKNYRSGVNFFTDGSISFNTSGTVTINQLKFDVDDAAVLHAGAEFFSTSQRGWGYAVRAGFYNAPDNRIRLTDVSVTSTDPLVTAPLLEGVLRDVFRGGEDVNHFTAGLSLNTPAGFQMQFAGDFADTGNEFLASAIYRFGKVR